MTRSRSARAGSSSVPLFLGLALYMAPALFGHAPQSLVWNRLIVGILPPDSSEFSAPVQVAGGGRRVRRQEVKATSTDPAQAEREEKSFHGVLWGMSLDQARELAAGREEADPDRLHRRQLRELPPDGAGRLPAARGRLAPQEVRDRPALHRLRRRSPRSPPNSGRSWPRAIRIVELELAKEATNPVLRRPLSRAARSSAESGATTNRRSSSIS